MSDVWPPPPKNQPAPEPPPEETSSGISAVICVSGGALLLALAAFAFMNKPLFELGYSYTALAIVGGAMLCGIALVDLGGWLGNRMKGTKNGRTASALCVIVNTVFVLFNFLYGQ